MIISRQRSRAAAFLAVALLAAGCGADAPASSASAPAPVPAQTPAPAPAPAPAPSPTPPPDAGTSGSSAPGLDARLDALLLDCERGDVGACETVYFESPLGSEYEERALGALSVEDMADIIQRNLGPTPSAPSTGGGSSGSLPNATGPALEPNGAPYFETLRLSSGFANDPREIVIGAAGGYADTSGLPAECRSASIGTRPDVRLIYDAGTFLPLNIYAFSRTDDLFLVVQLPNGQFRCNDDYSGLNPAVLISNPQSGTYNIWLGVFGAEFGAGTLAISELTPRFR